MRKQQAVRPLVILPGGYYISEADVRRIRLTRRVQAVIEGVVFAGVLLMLLFITTWMGPVQ